MKLSVKLFYFIQKYAHPFSRRYISSFRLTKGIRVGHFLNVVVEIHIFRVRTESRRKIDETSPTDIGGLMA